MATTVNELKTDILDLERDIHARINHIQKKHAVIVTNVQIDHSFVVGKTIPDRAQVEVMVDIAPEVEQVDPSPEDTGPKVLFGKRI